MPFDLSRKSGYVDHGHHAAFRAASFKAIGGYDETFSHNEDAEFDGALEIDQETGLIANVGTREGRSDLDTEGCVLFAGFGDLHVHGVALM